MINYYISICIRQGIEQFESYFSFMLIIVVGARGNPQPTVFSDCPEYYFKFTVFSFMYHLSKGKGTDGNFKMAIFAILSYIL